jgi:hypothetical protein
MCGQRQHPDDTSLLSFLLRKESVLKISILSKWIPVTEDVVETSLVLYSTILCQLYNNVVAEQCHSWNNADLEKEKTYHDMTAEKARIGTQKRQSLVRNGWVNMLPQQQVNTQQ